MKIRLAFCLLLLATILGGGPASHAQAKPVRWGFYVKYDSDSFVSLQNNITTLTDLSPWYYNLDGAGNLTGSRDEAVNALARQYGLRLLPMIQNSVTGNDFHNILSDPTLRDHALDQLRAIARKNGYDGLCLDFETLNASDAALYADFAARLSAALHADGRLLAMAVAPKTANSNDGFSGVYDYTALAPALDYVIIMAYDFHYLTGGPGPIAPADWVGRAAAYASTRFAAGQVLWGLGLYGFDWNRTVAGRAKGLRYSDLAALKAQHPPLTEGFDLTAQSPYFTYLDGSQLHEVWYENAGSIAAKLKVIAPYGFAGVGLWRLGQEDTAIWPLLGQDSSQPFACQPVAPFQSDSRHLYFATSGHALSNAFLNYWQAHGGLPIYGYPISEEFSEQSKLDGRSYTVQYFERARFEYHPELAGTAYEVLLGQLGRSRYGRVDPASPAVPNSASQFYFAETGHAVSGSFYTYWQQHGGLAQFGYPISEVLRETNRPESQLYEVQYFERARFEYHPELVGSDHEVLLGLLGKQFSPCR